MHELTDMRLLLPPMQVCPACLHVRDTHPPQVLQMALQVSSGWMLMGELQAPKSRRLRSFSSWSLRPLGQLLMHELPTMPRCTWGTPTRRRWIWWYKFPYVSLFIDEIGPSLWMGGHKTKLLIFLNKIIQQFKQSNSSYNTCPTALASDIRVDLYDTISIRLILICRK